MGNASSSMQKCKACKDYGNRQTDTVKVDFGMIHGENSAPAPSMADGMSKEQIAEEKRLAEEAQERERRREEEEEKQRQEVEAKRHEILRLQKEEEERERQRQEAEKLRQQQEQEEMERRRAALEEKLRQAELERIELARIAEERERQRQEKERRQRAEEERQRQRRREQEEKQRQMQRLAAERNARLQGMLEEAGFTDVNDKKVKKGMLSTSFSFPLHAAVEAQDLEFVELLLWAGADPLCENSKKQTPTRLAEKKNDKNGSHAKVIRALRRSTSAAKATKAGA